MKKTILKIAFASLLGFSLSACTILNDLGITKGNVTKMASYKNEVTFTEFFHKLANSEFKTTVNKSDFHMKDGVADFGLDLEAKETITNDSYTNKTRSKMEAKSSVSLSADYDADTQIVDGTLKDEISYCIENSFLGEASAKHKGKWNYIFQPYQNGYAIANKDDQTYWMLETGSNFSLNKSLEQLFKMAAGYLDELDQAASQSAAQIDQTLKQYNLKFYVDGNIFTVTGHYAGAQELGEGHYVYNSNTNTYDYVQEVYGRADFDLDLEAQIKITKVTQLRAEANGTIKADFYKDHNAIANGLFSFLDIATNTCVRGDVEEISLKASAGMNLEQKSVNNKAISLSNYKLLNYND